MNKSLYKLKDNKVIFYPQRSLIAFSIIIDIPILLIAIPISFDTGVNTFYVLATTSILLVLLTTLLVSIARYTQVVIDLESGKIIKKTFRVKKEIASFTDVRNIELIEDSTTTYVSGYKYVININKVPYAIPLTHSLRRGAKNLQIYKNNIIPIVEKAIRDASSNSPRAISNLDQSYTLEYFKPSRRDCYSYSQNKLSYLLIPVTFMGASLFLEKPAAFFGISIGILAIFLYLYGKRIDIDVYNRTIGTSFWGIFNEENYSFDDIISIEQNSETKTTNTGVGYGEATIAIKLHNKGSIKNVVIHSDRNQEKIIGIIHELRLLSGIEKNHE